MSRRKFRRHRHKKHLTPEQLLKKRRILSILLFICVTALSVCGVLKLSVFNPEQIVSQFVDASYINALREDIYQYAQDKCIESGIPYDVIDENITYHNIYNIQNSYISNAINASDQFNSEAFEAHIQSLKSQLATSTEKMLSSDGIKITDGLQKNIDAFATDIADYTQSRVVFENIDKMASVLNFGNDALLVICGVLAIIILVLMLILFFTGHKKYRNLRYATYSFSGAAIFNVCIVGVIAIIKSAKSLVIYPSYVSNAISNYLTDCMQDISLTALGLFLISIFAVTFVWQLKRDKL